MFLYWDLQITKAHTNSFYHKRLSPSIKTLKNVFFMWDFIEFFLHLSVAVGMQRAMAADGRIGKAKRGTKKASARRLASTLRDALFRS